MSIRKLPEYMINRLKAGEIVERPASVCKELVENSLDAGADQIILTIDDGGKSLIRVEDNGVGIELSDMDLLLERYATSKIYGEQDLYTLKSYGFRGEALASISEVGKTHVLSKTAYSEIGTKLSKINQEIIIKHMPVAFNHGTVVSVEDLFFNVPARLKFLKSSQTEFFYCYNYFVDVALFHYDKKWRFLKGDKLVFDLEPANDHKTRVYQLFKKDWSGHIKEIDIQEEDIHIKGLISDAGLTFGSAENIKIYVNGRPIMDKIIKKALMDAYGRQIPFGEYPFALLMFDISPNKVDVNVHPKKMEVKFIDSQAIYQLTMQAVESVFQKQKTIATHAFDTIVQNMENAGEIEKFQSGFSFDTQVQNIIQQTSLLDSEQQQILESFQEEIGSYKVIGQLRERYIILEATDALYYIDQHALAERIAFEKMKKEWMPKMIKKYPPSFDEHHIKSEILLQPVSIQLAQRADLEEKINQLQPLGFDCALLGEQSVIIYSIPEIFSIYKVDLEKAFTVIFGLEEINFDTILEKIFASKACKTSIKAGDKLHLPQMVQLIKDGFEYIPGMFVCQHGRPFFIKIEKPTIDKLFDR